MTATQLGELSVLGEKADARMQRVDTFELGHPYHAHGIEITFIRRVATDADQAIARQQLIHGGGFHVRVRLHQYHFDALSLRDADELGRRAAAGVDQCTPHRADQIRIGVTRLMRTTTYLPD